MVAFQKTSATRILTSQLAGHHHSLPGRASGSPSASGGHAAVAARGKP